MSKTNWLWVGVLAVAAVGLARSAQHLGAQCCGGCQGQATAAAQTQPQAADKDEVVEYYCTMHPNVVKAEPGKCPLCGMALVKRAKPATSRPTTSQPTSKPAAV
jgi:hypothetical protein